MEESLERFLCPNHHISDGRQRKGMSALIYSSSSWSQRNVGNIYTYQLLMPMAQGIGFDKKTYKSNQWNVLIHSEGVVTVNSNVK